MPATAEKPAPVSTLPAADLDAGDWVFLAYWQAFALPGQPKNGTWETALVRVVSVGRAAVVVEVSNPSVLSIDAVSGSSLRFVPPGHLFRERESALAAVQSFPNPA